MTPPITDKALLAAFDARMRAEARPDEPGAHIERADGVLRQTGARPDNWHGVLYSDLDTTTADAAIQAQIEYFRSLGTDFEWKLYSHDRPTDLGARLSAAGFEPGDPETLFVAEITRLAGAGLTETLPEGVTLRPVTTVGDAELVAEAAEAAFGSGGEWARDRALARLAEDPETVWTWLAMAGDQPVSTARMLVYPGTGFAGLWGGGTAPQWRGRGIYRALVARRMQVAAELGCEYLQVDASDMSRPILERLGFRALSVTTPYEFRFLSDRLKRSRGRQGPAEEEAWSSVSAGWPVGAASQAGRKARATWSDGLHLARSGHPEDPAHMRILIADID